MKITTLIYLLSVVFVFADPPPGFQYIPTAETGRIYLGELESTNHRAFEIQQEPDQRMFALTKTESVVAGLCDWRLLMRPPLGWWELGKTVRDEDGFFRPLSVKTVLETNIVFYITDDPAMHHQVGDNRISNPEWQAVALFGMEHPDMVTNPASAKFVVKFTMISTNTLATIRLPDGKEYSDLYLESGEYRSFKERSAVGFKSAINQEQAWMKEHDGDLLTQRRLQWLTNYLEK